MKYNYLKNKINFKFITFILIIISLIFVVFYFFFKSNKNLYNEKIYEIGQIIEDIDKKCKIICFANEHNPIDFLNVKEFSGNHIGSIQIANPKNWTGPYLEQIALYKQKPINIFVHSSGCYIIPGEGTLLSENKIVGKDIIFDSSFNEEEFFKNYPCLFNDNKRLIYKLKINVKAHEKIKNEKEEISIKK